MEIEEHAAVRCPRCDAVDADTRRACICARDGVQVNQYQSLLHAISRTLERHGIPHRMESGEAFNADRNLRKDIITRRGGLRDAPNREYRDKSILLDVPTQTHKCKYTCRKAALITMDQLPLPPRCASVNATMLVRAMCPRRTKPQACHCSGGMICAPRLGVEGGNFIDHLATNLVGRRDGGSMTRNGVVEELLIEIVSGSTQVTISSRVSRFKLQTQGPPGRKKEPGVVGMTDRHMAWGWSLDMAWD